MLNGLAYAVSNKFACLNFSMKFERWQQFQRRMQNRQRLWIYKRICLSLTEVTTQETQKYHGSSVKYYQTVTLPTFRRTIS